ncbi:MAG: DUF2202 domain-containing protein [Pseudomonadota bacterium]|nr:DUF2202 domain-containing protein [Pseudomonadota bacterium]
MLREFSAFVSVLVLVLAGASSVTAGRGPGSGGDPSTLSDEEIYYLEYMREEEKLARDSYMTLYDLWGNPVFFNISTSEQQHMDAVENLLDRYGLPDPVVDETNVGDFVNPELQALFDELMATGAESELAALNVGGLIEEKDMRDIQIAIDLADNADIKATYDNLLCGSRNHLRSFVKNIELLGSTYTASILTQEEVDEIAYSPMERCVG